jgi:hypothetical protein
MPPWLNATVRGIALIECASQGISATRQMHRDVGIVESEKIINFEEMQHILYVYNAAFRPIY